MPRGVPPHGVPRNVPRKTPDGVPRKVPRNAPPVATREMPRVPPHRRALLRDQLRVRLEWPDEIRRRLLTGGALRKCRVLSTEPRALSADP